jgi:hypothetical protein
LKKASKADAIAGPCAANSARPQKHRDDRQRAEQHARVAPAERLIAEAPDRQCDQLLCQRRMHRIEDRRRHHRLEHLPRGRHIMHFIEVGFFRRGQSDQQGHMRGKKQDGRNNDNTGGRIVKGRFGWKRFFRNRTGFVHDISRNWRCHGDECGRTQQRSPLH